MGLSIHYSSHLKEAELLPDLIQEVKDVAEVYGWEYRICNTTFPDNQFSKETSFEEFYGISFTPANCETISFVFLSNGRMVCPARVKFSDDSEKEKGNSWVYTNSVKTQFAGVMIHQLLVQFFRYLNGKYFRDFQMSDESNYWETNDEEKTKEQFKAYDTLLDNVLLATETFPMGKNEDITAYFERLLKHINSLR